MKSEVTRPMPPRTARSKVYQATALLLTVVGAVTGAACWRGTPTAADPAPAPTALPTQPALFDGWDKPDFVLLLSAQQHGYLLPCGCSRPQYGGLERRYNLLQKLRQERGWEVIPVDLGDIPQSEGPAKLANEQGLLKYEVTMKALEKMGYLAVGLGEFEGAQRTGLSGTIDQYALNNPKPAVLAANLKDKARNFPDETRRSKSYVGSWEMTTTEKGIKVGALGLVGYEFDKDKIGKADEPISVALLIGRRNPDTQFLFPPDVIPGALKEMKAAGVEFPVALYQGPIDKARLMAKYVPDFRVILCLSESDEPPGRAEVENEGGSMVVRVGHKGKNVGVVGVWRTGKPDRPYTMRYQLVRLGEEYLTPEAQEADHPIVALMERYARDLKSAQPPYLVRYTQRPHLVQTETQKLLDENKKPRYEGQVSQYVGSQACKPCHKHAYQVWEESAHSHAYPTLVDAKRPGLRHHDPECIVCHVVGFGYTGGFKDESSPQFLRGVGCESCHGPGGLHVENKEDDDLYPLINPWRGRNDETKAQREARLLKIESQCMSCHDSDNDVHWTFEKWEKKKIIHMTPKKNR